MSSRPRYYDSFLVSQLKIIEEIITKFLTNKVGMSNKSPIKPLGDRVVVRPLTEEEVGSVSVSGIFIPDSAKEEKPEQGVVLAVGTGKWDADGAKRIPMEVKEGDRVVFSKYGYDEVKFDKEKYFIVSEVSILGVFN